MAGKSPVGRAAGEGAAGIVGIPGLPTLMGARTGNCSVNAAGPCALVPSVAARTPTD